METTITTTKPTAKAVATATKAVTEYRDNGNGSNRTNWDRMTAILSAVLTVTQTGRSVEITDLFTETTKAPAYHLAHRSLSAGVIRPEWSAVQVVTIRNAGMTAKGSTVTGDSTTTGLVGTVRIFLVPTE